MECNPTFDLRHTWAGGMCACVGGDSIANVPSTQSGKCSSHSSSGTKPAKSGLLAGTAHSLESFLPPQQTQSYLFLIISYGY